MRVMVIVKASNESEAGHSTDRGGAEKSPRGDWVLFSQTSRSISLRANENRPIPWGIRAFNRLIKCLLSITYKMLAESGGFEPPIELLVL